MPQSDKAIAFLKHCKVPIAAPSANISGTPSTTSWQDVYQDFEGKIACILKGPSSRLGLESTVIDCTETHPKLLRLGSFPLKKLLKSLGDAHHLLLTNTQTKTPKSPGIKYTHYAPRAQVVITNKTKDLNLGPQDGFIGITSPKLSSPSSLVLICKNPHDYARCLFSFFRKCDNYAMSKIFCQEVNKTGIGASIMDRLHRARESQ